MSEKKDQVSDDIENISDENNEDQKTSVEDLQKQIKALNSKNKELLGEKKNMQGKLSTFEKEKELEKKQRLEDDGKLKELNEVLEKDLEDEKNKNKNMLSNLDKALKIQSVKDSLPAKLVNEEYIKFVDLEKITIDDDGKVNSDSLKIVVDSFVSAHTALLDFEKPDIPSKSPKGSDSKDGKIKRSEWEKLPLKEMKKRSKDVIDD